MFQMLHHFLKKKNNNLVRSLDMKIICSRKSGIMRVDLIRRERQFRNFRRSPRLLEISCIRRAEYLKCSIFRGKTPELTNRGMA